MAIDLEKYKLQKDNKIDLEKYKVNQTPSTNQDIHKSSLLSSLFKNPLGIGGIIGENVIKPMAEAITEPLVKAGARPFVSAIQGLRGTEEPISGVKPYTAMTPAESAKEQLELLTTAAVEPALKLAGKALSPVYTKFLEIRAGKVAEKGLSKIEEMIKPVLTKKGVSKEVMAGRATGGELEASKQLKETAQTLQKQGIIDPKKTFVENVNATLDRTTEINQSLKTYLKENPKELGTGFSNAFDASLKTIEKPIPIKSSEQLDKAYDLVRKKAFDIAKTKKTTEQLLEGRQEFDAFVNKEFGQKILNPSDPTWKPMKQAVLDIRREFNNFISGYYKEETVIADSLKLEHQLLNASENMAVKAAKEIQDAAKLKQMGKVKAFFSKHPILREMSKAIGYTTGGLIGGKLISQSISGD